MPTHLRLELCLIALVIIISGCGGGSGVREGSGGLTTPAAHLDHISISPSSLTVAPGASFTFTASAFYKGESQEKKFPSDWEERKCSRCFPAHLMLRGSGDFRSL
jgi:hypothetical protein